MTWHVVDAYDSYANARASFEWGLPDRYNPARDLLRKHDQPERPALTVVSDASKDNSPSPDHSLSFRTLDERSDRLAAALADLGIEPGDRVGVIVPQRPANPISHLAIWKLGAITVPLTVLFGPNALGYRLADSGARAVVVDPAVRETVADVRGETDLEYVIELGSNDEVAGDAYAFDALLSEYETGYPIHDSTPETPSALMYTSGSTGPPKGVLHSHALWLGRAAAAFTYFDHGLAGATVWTPADWAWGAALGGTLFATWHYGGRVVAWPRQEFDSHDAFGLMAATDVTHAFMPPTALRELAHVADPTVQFDLSLETLATAGEPLTPELLEWVADAFDDVALNEFYGQTELNLCVGNCSRWFEPRSGSMGTPLPGYAVTVLDPETREPVAAGEVGEIAVKPGDRRIFFDRYWGRPEQTAAKETADGWFLTGDLARCDEDGFLFFEARRDDVILTRGYRVGPVEVESTLLDHPAVEQVGVIGVDHDRYGEAIKAFIKPAGDVDPDASLEADLREHVREQLASYEYPEEIEFVDSLPRTTTGKIRRESLRAREEST